MKRLTLPIRLNADFVRSISLPTSFDLSIHQFCPPPPPRPKKSRNRKHTKVSRIKARDSVQLGTKSGGSLSIGFQTASSQIPPVTCCFRSYHGVSGSCSFQVASSQDTPDWIRSRGWRRHWLPAIWASSPELSWTRQNLRRKQCFHFPLRMGGGGVPEK